MDVQKVIPYPRHYNTRTLFFILLFGAHSIQKTAQKWTFDLKNAHSIQKIAHKMDF